MTIDIHHVDSLLLKVADYSLVSVVDFDLLGNTLPLPDAPHYNPKRGDTFRLAAVRKELENTRGAAMLDFASLLISLPLLTPQLVPTVYSIKGRVFRCLKHTLSFT